MNRVCSVIVLKHFTRIVIDHFNMEVDKFEMFTSMRGRYIKIKGKTYEFMQYNYQIHSNMLFITVRDTEPCLEIKPKGRFKNRHLYGISVLKENV